MKYQILVDSASDLNNDYLKKEKNIGFKVIPLTILANGKEFVDTDDLIVDKIKMPINAFLTKDNENSFRDIEEEVIKTISSQNNS